MLSLLHPVLLPWLVAIGIPIGIHLLTRRARQRMDLPTVRFVQRTLAQQSKLFRWRHILLLVLRTLIILGLVGVFLKPTWNAPLAGAGAESPGVVLILDVSASMGHGAAGRTALAQARSEAAKTLQGLPAGARVNVVFAGASPTTAFTAPVSDIRAAVEAVKSATLTEERGDPVAAIATAAEQIVKTNARAGSRQLYLFSDFQRTNWAEAKFDTLPVGTRAAFVQVTPPVRENIGLTAIRLRPPVPRVGETVTVACDVFNSSGATRSVPVTLTLGDGTRSTQNVTLPPYSSAAATFPLVFDSPKRIEATVAIPGDELASDDTRRVVIDLQQALSVVLITDEDASQPPAASFFLARALRPDPTVAGGIRLTVVKPNALNNPILRSADAVIVCGAPGMPSVQYEALSRYTTGGGSLIWFLYGDRIAEQMQALAKQLPAAEPMPFQIESVADLSKNGRGYVTLAEARYESPLLKLFKDPAAADLSRIHVSRFCVTSEVAKRAEVLLKYDDGTAAVVRTGEGSGTLLLVNLVPTPTWSDLARQEAFPPLIHEFVKGILSGDTGGREFFPGGIASVTLPSLPRDITAERLICAGPGGTIPVTADPVTGAVVTERIAKSGFYRITMDGQPAGILAVNPHGDESDLRSMDPRELEAGTRDVEKARSLLAGVSGNTARVEDLQKNRPLWQYLVLFTILLLLTEQWLSRLKPTVRSGGQK